MMNTAIRLVLSLIAITLVLWAASVEADASTGCLGFPLPPNSQQIEPNRFALGQNWEQTMTFYRRAFEGTDRVRRFLIVSIPGVTAMHFRNQSDPGRWAGANVSRIAGRIYVFCYPKGATDR